MKNFQERFTQESIILMLPVGLIGSKGCFRTKTLVTLFVISDQENLKKHCRMMSCYKCTQRSVITRGTQDDYAILFIDVRALDSRELW